MKIHPILGTSYGTGWFLGKINNCLDFSANRRCIPKLRSKEAAELQKEMEQVQIKSTQLSNKVGELEHQLKDCEEDRQVQIKKVGELQEALKKTSTQAENLRKQLRSKDVAYSAARLEILALKSKHKDLQEKIDSILFSPSAP